MSYQLAQHGVIALYTGNDPTVMRLQPPLIIQPDEVDEVLQALDDSMAAIVAGTAGSSAHVGSGGERKRRRPGT
jgi:acetylornithine/succinyldiaminopimelate/putrescine aminotransferase